MQLRVIRANTALPADVYMTERADELGAALEHWTQQRVLLVRPSTAPAPSVLRALGSVVSGTLSRDPHAHTDSASLACLPQSLFRLVCMHLKLVDLVSLSHTGSSMRRRLLDDTEIWRDLTRVPDSPVFPHRLLHMLIPRSSPGPLTIRLNLEPRDVERCIDVLRSALPRASSLSLLASPAAPVRCRVHALLSEPAPLLERLELVSYRSIRSDPTAQPADWNVSFAGAAPRLRHCYLATVGPSCLSAPAFRYLTCLEYHDDRIVRGEVISSILGALPCLETLGLTGSTCADAPSASPGPRRCPKNILLKFDHAQDLEPFRDVRFEAVSHLILLGRVPFMCQVLALFRIEGLSIGLSGWRAQLADGAPTRVEGYEFHAGLLAHPSAPLWTALSWLALHECMWPHDAPPPALPNVTVLCVCLTTPRTRFPIYRIGEDSIFAMSPGAAWRVPRLREVRLTVPPPGPLSVSLVDVRWFVRTALSFDAPALHTVLLAGLEAIDRDFCAAWTMLRGVAEHVVLEEEPDTRCYREPRHYTAHESMYLGARVHIDLDEYFAE